MRSNALAPKRRSLALALTAVLALVTGLLALIPLPVSAALPGSDTHHHFLAFMALVLPVATLTPKLLLPLLPVLASYGLLIELLQPWVGRNGDVTDALADGLGLLAGLVFGMGLHYLLFGFAQRMRTMPGSSLLPRD